MALITGVLSMICMHFDRLWITWFPRVGRMLRAPICNLFHLTSSFGTKDVLPVCNREKPLPRSSVFYSSILKQDVIISRTNGKWSICFWIPSLYKKDNILYIQWRIQQYFESFAYEFTESGFLCGWFKILFSFVKTGLLYKLQTIAMANIARQSFILLWN